MNSTPFDPRAIHIRESGTGVSFVLLMAAIAYSIQELALIRLQGKDSQLAKAVGQDFKGKISCLHRHVKYLNKIIEADYGSSNA
jgi:hypothetical protein